MKLETLHSQDSRKLSCRRGTRLFLDKAGYWFSETQYNQCLIYGVQNNNFTNSYYLVIHMQV